MGKRQQIGLSIDKKIWEEYYWLCEGAKLMVSKELKWFLTPSRRIEGFMKRDIEKIKRQFGKKMIMIGDKGGIVVSDTKEKD